MNESDSIWFNINTLIIVSEIAAVLAIILIAILVLSYRKRTKKKLLTIDFLDDVKVNEVQREDGLAKKLDDTTSLDDLEKGVLVKTLVDSEKKAYLHIAQLYMGYKPESLKDLEDEVKSISDNYIDIIEKVSKNPSEGGGSSSGENGEQDDDAVIRELKKQVTFLREEKKALKFKNAQLQVDFDASVDSIERMTTEFASMYEGGSKEGEKRIKNEMYQLRQVLAKKLEVTSDDADADESNEDLVEDLDGNDIPDMDLSSDSSSADDATDEVISNAASDAIDEVISDATSDGATK